jgi:hypothetical protein
MSGPGCGRRQAQGDSQGNDEPPLHLGLLAFRFSIPIRVPVGRLAQAMNG